MFQPSIAEAEGSDAEIGPQAGQFTAVDRTVGMSEAAGFQAIEIEDQGARAGDRRGRQAVTVTTTRG